MNEQEIIELLKITKAILKGHFLLSSGRHSEMYFQTAQVFQYPDLARRIGDEIAQFFERENIDMVVSPAVGGIILGYAVAQSLNKRMIFTERKNGKMKLRRSFWINEGERALIVEDVMTTGGTTREVMSIVEEQKGVMAGIACMINRAEVDKIEKVTVNSLLKMPSESYLPSECPLCNINVPLIKPGSRVG